MSCSYFCVWHFQALPSQLPSSCRILPRPWSCDIPRSLHPKPSLLPLGEALTPDKGRKLTFHLALYLFFHASICLRCTFLMCWVFFFFSFEPKSSSSLQPRHCPSALGFNCSEIPSTRSLCGAQFQSCKWVWPPASFQWWGKVFGCSWWFNKATFMDWRDKAVFSPVAGWPELVSGHSGPFMGSGGISLCVCYQWLQLGAVNLSERSVLLLIVCVGWCFLMQNVGNNVSVLPLQMVSTVGMWDLSKLSREKHPNSCIKEQCFWCYNRKVVKIARELRHYF